MTTLDATASTKIRRIGLKLRDPDGNELPATFGSLTFQSKRPDSVTAKYAVVSSNSEPDDVVELLRVWLPEKPRVVISVTGSAQAMNLDQTLEKLITKGLASAARSMSAWIIDGGSDSGVMELMGEAFADSNGEVPVIGVAPWRMVTHRELFFDAQKERARIAAVAKVSSAEAARVAPSIAANIAASLAAGTAALTPSSASASSRNPPAFLFGSSTARGSSRKLLPTIGGGGNGGNGSGSSKRPAQTNHASHVHYVKRKPNGAKNTAIDSLHTHMLLVDDPDKEWGGEVKLRAAVESSIRKTLGAPGVLLVVQGGPGTYQTVEEQLQYKREVVLVKESGGCAGVVATFVQQLDEAAVYEKGKDRDEKDMWRRLVRKLAPDYRDKLPNDSDEFYQKFMRIAEQRELLHVYSALDQSRHSFEMVMMMAFCAAYRRANNEEALLHEKKVNVKTLQRLDDPSRPPHANARSQQNPAYPDRFPVPDDKVKWPHDGGDDWPGYTPKAFTDKVVVANDRERKARGEGGHGWADPPDVERMQEELKGRRTYCFSGGFMKQGNDAVGSVISWDTESRAPLNPGGRTGMKGRGLLGKWGPNHAADPIVTRWHVGEDRRRRLQMVAVKRKDVGDWAIPGGMVDEGEEVSVTLKREFAEEAGALSDAKERAEFDALTDHLFKSGVPIYTGYVDDPRNTDNAWMETQAMHFHCPDELGQRLMLQGGDDASKAAWIDIDPLREPRYAALYASHREWVDRIAECMRSYPCTASSDVYARADVVQPRWEITPPTLQPYTPTEAPGGEPITAEERLTVLSGLSFERPSHYELRPEKAQMAISTMQATARMPCNPRGRTGVSGRGKLPSYGPNHEVSVLVTRYDPTRGSQLQVAAICNYREPPVLPNPPQKPFKEPPLELPSGPLPEAAVAASSSASAGINARLAAARGVFLEPALELAAGRVLLRPSHEGELVDEIFREVDLRSVVYAGYKDDARNTDHAWLETTVVHCHCPLELGGRVWLENYSESKELVGHDADHHSRLCWLDVHVKELGESIAVAPTGVRQMEQEWLENVAESMQRRKQPALLQLAARWGRPDVVHSILSNPKDLIHCQPSKVQAAFTEALRHATRPTYDTRVIGMLLDHGARPADLYGPGLFLDGPLNTHEGVMDAFGLITKVRKKAVQLQQLAQEAAGAGSGGDGGGSSSSGEDGRPKSPGRISRSMTRSFSRSPPRAAKSPSGLTDSGDELNESFAGGVPRVSSQRSRKALQMMMAKGRLVVGSSKFGRGGKSSMIPPKVGSSWPDAASSYYLTVLVPGFERFAEKNQVVDLADISFWALACGSFDLARLMWSRSRCPVRNALLLSHACKTIDKEVAGGIETEFTEKLRRYAARFNSMAEGVLDHISETTSKDEKVSKRGADGEEEKVSPLTKVLSCKAGPYATLGASKGEEVSLIDLAIRFNNKAFASHRKVQMLMDEHWRGESTLAGHLRLPDGEGSRGHLGLLQGLLPFLPILELGGVKLEKNTLFDARAFPITASLRHIPVIQRVVGIYQIPSIKREMETASRLLFLALFSYAALTEPCAPFESANYVVVVWTAAFILEELHEALSDWALYTSRAASQRLDLAIILLLIAMSFFRYYLQFALPEHGVVDFVEFMHNRSGGLVRPDPQITGMGWPQEPLEGNMKCEWTFELEAYQTVTAVLAILVALRTFECFSLLDETGVLMITSVEMFTKMLAWLPLVFFLSLGSAVGMNVLAPNYAVELSPGAFHLPLRDFIGDFSAGGSFFSPFWAIYGYVEPGALALGRGTAFITPLFMWIYLMVSLVLFVNLLIAVFNDAYNAVQEEKSKVWKMQRLLLVKTHLEGLPLPAPLNAPLAIFWMLRAAINRLARRARRGVGGPSGGGGASSSSLSSSSSRSSTAMTPSSTAKVAPTPPAFYTSSTLQNLNAAASGTASGRGGGAGGYDDDEEALALEEALEAEEIERVARMKYLRLQPLHALEKAEKEAAKGEMLEERLGQLELKQSHYNLHSRAMLQEITLKLDRAMAGGMGALATVSVGGSGGGGGGSGSRQWNADEALAVQVFQAFDKDQSGDISVSELQPALKQLGMRVGKSEVKTIMKNFGGADDGALSLDAFVEFVHELKDFQRVHSRSLRIFNTYDYDGSGELSRNEMRGALADLGYDRTKLSDDELDQRMAEFDGDHSSGIDLDEFTKLVVSLERKKEEEQRAAAPPPAAAVVKPAPAPSPARAPAPAPAPAPADLPPTPTLPPPLAKLSVDDGGGALLPDEAPPPPPSSGDYLPPEGWWKGLTEWWQQAESDWKAETRRLEKDIGQQVSDLRQQSGTLAHVTNHLAHEVSRLRPEYWQRAHRASMAPPHYILEPPPSELRAATQRNKRGTGPYMPLLDDSSAVGDARRGPRGGEPRNLSDLPPSHPIAHPHDYAQLQRVFDMFDADHDGTLDASELRSALRSLGLGADMAQAAKILRKYDKDRSGSIEMAEFRTLVAELRHFQKGGAAIGDEVHRTFFFFDRDGSGAIDARELVPALNTLGMPTDSQQAASIMRKYDADKSGTLELAEFRQLVNDLREFKRNLDEGGEPLPTSTKAARPAPQLPVPRGPTTGSATFWESVKEVFTRYDRDASNSIDAKELREALNALGLRCDSQQARQILSRYDTGGKGSLRLDEFRRLVEELRAFETGGEPTALPTPAWVGNTHEPPTQLYTGWEGRQRTVQSGNDDYEGKRIL